MGRKTNKEKLQEVKDRALTVEQVIEILKKYPKDAYLGAVGYFGEFHHLGKYDFSQTKAYITSDYNWRSGVREDVEVVSISWPDIGPQPD